MESSNVGRLGLKSKTHFHWKGKTFSQVSSTIQKNTRSETAKPESFFFRALPNKIYRREILSIDNQKGARDEDSKISQTMDIPGGTIVNTSSSTLCEGILGTIDLNFDESKTAMHCRSDCNSYLENDSVQRNSKYIQSLSLQDNARRRVRSSGMMRPRFKENKNGELDHYASSAQYLHSRNKTFKQNQFNNLRIGNSSAIPGSAASQDNIYASNTIQYCDSTSSMTNFVPVYYKPNNPKFAKQGAVDAGCHMTRLKNDTITNSSNLMRVAYGVSANGYTIKDKIGYPNKCTPTILKFECITTTSSTSVILYDNVTIGQEVQNWQTLSIKPLTTDPAHIQNWNTQNVTNMSGLFQGDTLFNYDIGGWNVSNVTNMSYMFSGAASFNQNLGEWNTSNVTDMTNMFQGATALQLEYPTLPDTPSTNEEQYLYQGYDFVLPAILM